MVTSGMPGPRSLNVFVSFVIVVWFRSDSWGCQLGSSSCSGNLPASSCQHTGQIFVSPAGMKYSHWCSTASSLGSTSVLPWVGVSSHRYFATWFTISAVLSISVMSMPSLVRRRRSSLLSCVASRVQVAWLDAETTVAQVQDVIWCLVLSALREGLSVGQGFSAREGCGAVSVAVELPNPHKAVTGWRDVEICWWRNGNVVAGSDDASCHFV